MEKPVVVKRGERRLIYALAIVTDVTQAIFNFFLVTEPLNHIIDIVVAALLIAYASKRGILDTNKLLVLLATFFGEQIPIVNALPFWTYDVHNLYKGIPKTEEEANIQPKVIGVTLPRNLRKPLNSIPGVRLPRKRMERNDVDDGEMSPA